MCRGSSAAGPCAADLDSCAGTRRWTVAGWPRTPQRHFGFVSEPDGIHLCHVVARHDAGKVRPVIVAVLVELHPPGFVTAKDVRLLVPVIVLGWTTTSASVVGEERFTITMFREVGI
jgi:hypothetical protein